MESQRPEPAFLLGRFVWALLKYLFFVTIPVSLSFYLWLVFRTDSLLTLQDGNIASLIPVAAQQILDGYPFANIISKFLMGSTTSTVFQAGDIVDGALKAILTYLLVDCAKAIFRLRSETAMLETKAARITKLICIYGTWTVLCVFLVELLTNDGFQLLRDVLPAAFTWPRVRLLLLLLLFVGAVLRFHLMTRAKWELCFVWVLVDELLFSVGSGLLLTFMTMWGYREYTRSGPQNILIPLLLYILFCASLDYVRSKTRVGIVALFQS